MTAIFKLNNDFKNIFILEKIKFKKDSKFKNTKVINLKICKFFLKSVYLPIYIIS